MNWVLIVNSSVQKILKRIPHKDAQRIVYILEELTVNPYAGDIRKMEGENDIWRKRIGSYRMKYEIQASQKVIRVLELTRRTSNTY